MMRVQLEIDRDIVLDRPFNSVHILAGADARPVADAKDMRVHRLCRVAPPHVQNHIGGLAPHTGQAFERCTRTGNLATVLIDKDAGELDDVFGLVAIKANRLDVFDYTLFAKGEHLLGCVGDFEQILGGFVHACVGCLSGQGDGHDQRVDVDMVEFALGFGLGVLEPREDLAERMIIELLGHRAFFCPLRTQGAN